jgi:oligoendopeptidase F
MLDATILTNPEVIRKEKENQDKQDALQAKSNAFRMRIPGETEPVSRAIYQKRLASTGDRKVREKLYHQFQAARANEWLKWGFKDLIRSRNEEARLAGFKNYFEYRFFRNQLDLAHYLRRLDEIKLKLAPKIRRELARMGRKAQIEKVEAWDLRYLREQAASGEINAWLAKVSKETPLELAKRFYSGMGFNIDSYHFLMDLYPRPGKNTHAFAMAVVMPHVDSDGHLLAEPAPDIRFLANLKRPVKWEDASTVIHEMGHAVHAAQVRQPIGLFRGIDPVETEAIAMTMERMAGSEEFLGSTLPDFVGRPKASLLPALGRRARAQRVEQAFVLLRQAFFSDFERQMYESPDADFAELWAKLHKDYWGVPVRPSEADWDVEHFVMAPVYIENYVIGILMVEQLYDSILKRFHTSYRSTALGDKLRKIYFAPGEEFDYLTLIENFTGQPLSATAALRLLD